MIRELNRAGDEIPALRQYIDAWRLLPKNTDKDGDVTMGDA